MKKLITLFCLMSVLIVGCSLKQESIHNSIKTDSTDVLKFTKNFDNSSQNDIDLNPLQNETMTNISNSFNIFIKEKSWNNFPSVNEFAKTKNWKVENNEKYFANLTDGSNIFINYKHFDFGVDTHEISIWNLNLNQCKKIIKEYKYNSKVKAKVEKITYIENGTSYINSSCSQLSNKESSIIVTLEYSEVNHGKIYYSVSKNLLNLFKENYKDLIETEQLNLYFSNKKLSNNNFLDGIEYAINKEMKKITIGALDTEKCKEIIYNLPTTINYKINGGNTCSKSDLNIIEFSAKE
jgi:hypothetical protein